MKKIIVAVLAVGLLSACDDPKDQPAPVTYDQPAPAQVGGNSTQEATPNGSGSQTVVVNGGGSGGGSGGGVGDFATGMILGHVMSNGFGGNNNSTHTREVIRERTIVKPSVTRSKPSKSYYGTSTRATPKTSYSAPRSSFSGRSYSSSKSYSSTRSSFGRSSFSSSRRR